MICTCAWPRMTGRTSAIFDGFLPQQNKVNAGATSSKAGCVPTRKHVIVIGGVDTGSRLREHQHTPARLRASEPSSRTMPMPPEQEARARASAPTGH